MSTRKSASAKAYASFRSPSGDTKKSILAFFEGLDTPKSLAAWILYRDNEHKQLVDLDVNPLDYNDFDSFRLDLAAVSFLAKADFLKIDVDRKAVALDKFYRAEQQCRETNYRLSHPTITSENSPVYWSLIFSMTRKISQLLGDCSMSDVVDSCGWGPGASFHIRGFDTSGTNKFLRERGITKDLYPLHAEISSFAWPTWMYDFHRANGVDPYIFVAGGHLTTVPKNAKTDRVIAIEPGFNLWYQKGIGSVLRSRLRRWGINLNDQSINQQLAKVASSDSTLATVDFSSASDTIAKRLIEEILPSDWFSLLDAARSKSVSVDGQFLYLEKFSSMGNGYTFELESLVFAAAAIAVCEHLRLDTDRISVYGDDVIIPVDALPLFRDFCNFIGFTINDEKTHHSSYYRESCGSHWFNGKDVKPIFLKKRIRNAEDVFKLANSIRRLAHRYNLDCGCDVRLMDTWSVVRDCLPRNLWLAIPDSLGDGGFVSNFDEATPSRARNLIEGFYAKHLVRTSKKYTADHGGHMIAHLWHQSNRPACAGLLGTNDEVKQVTDHSASGNFVPLRSVSRVSVAVSLVPKWYDFGPWI